MASRLIRLLKTLRVPIAIYLAFRAAGLVEAVAASWLEPSVTLRATIASWDSAWYLTIAEDGYPASSSTVVNGGNRWAFFPAFPLAIRITHYVTGLSYFGSAVLINFVFGLIAVSAIWWWAKTHFGKNVATWSVAALCFFPSAYVLSMIYTEPMFLACAGLCLVFLDRRWWLAASLAASLGSTVREAGAALVVAVGVAALREWRQLRAIDWLSLLTAGIGFLSWLAYQYARTGNPLTFHDAQQTWGYEFRWFTTPMRSAWVVIQGGVGARSAADVLATIALGFVIAAIVAAFLPANRRKMSWHAWTFSALTVIVAFGAFWPTSILRYVFAAFPLFAVLFNVIPPRLRPATVGALALTQGAVAVVAFASIANWQHAPFAP